MKISFTQLATKYHLRFPHFRNTISKKEWVICTLMISLLCTVYIVLLRNQGTICEKSYEWDSDLPSLNMLVNTSNIFISPVPSCSESPLLLVIIVCSAAPNFAARQAIRSTWGSAKSLGKGIKSFFLIGRSMDTLADSFIFEEKLDYPDIIHYNFLDTYFNLTLKSVLLLDYVKHACSNATYIMKADDDTFVNVANLRELLSQRPHSPALIGNLIEYAERSTDHCSKWFVPRNIYSKQFYPNYLSGSGYVLSYELSSALLDSALSLSFFPFEDIFITGLCTEVIGLTPENNVAFYYTKPCLNACTFRKLITAHRVTPKEHIQIWHEMNNLPPSNC